MQVIQRMNKKLDLGWKLTNSNCQKCNGVTLADPNNLSQYYCPKCDNIFQYQQDQQQQNQNQSSQLPKQKAPAYPSQQQQDQDYFNQVIAQTGIFNKNLPQSQNQPQINQQKQSTSQYSYQRKQQRTKDVSKKLGQKLLQGWTMLQASCPDCNVPLMKSKKGQKICFGCDKDYAAIQSVKEKSSPNTFDLQVSSKLESELTKKTDHSKKIETVQTAKITEQKNDSINKRQDLIETIQLKALKFLQSKMDKAIDDNDLGSVEKLLCIIQTFKK